MKGLARTAIPYLDLHWPIATGCIQDKPCWDHCWARNMARRFHRDFTPTFHSELLDAPLRSRAPARTVVGIAFGGDLGLMRTDQIRAVIGIICARRDLTFVLLTKRPERLAAALSGLWTDACEAVVTEAERFLLRPVKGLGSFPPENVHLGFSAWDQRSFDFGWNSLAPLASAGWRVWCSLEPMLGAVDVAQATDPVGACGCSDTEHGIHTEGCPCHPSRLVVGEHGIAHIGGIILGAESGPGARPLPLAWVRTIRDQCAEAGVPFCWKQGVGDDDGFGCAATREIVTSRPGKYQGVVPVLDGQVHTQTPWAEESRC